MLPKRGRPQKYPWDDIEPGQSFEVSSEEPMMMVRAWRSIECLINERRKKGTIFAATVVKVNGADTIRVWRLT